MDIPSPYIDSTRFTIKKVEVLYANHGRPQTIRLACASLLKPLYMWSASHLKTFEFQEAAWFDLAHQGITISSNHATNQVWERYGATSILASLKDLTSVDFTSLALTSWGGIKVDAAMVARGYGSMLSATACDRNAAQIVALMKQVKRSQTFQLNDIAMHHYSRQRKHVGVKCGWFVDKATSKLLTHAVIFIELANGTIDGYVILTSVPVNRNLIHDYLEAYHQGEEVLDIHEKISGNILRYEFSRLLGSNLVDRG